MLAVFNARGAAVSKAKVLICMGLKFQHEEMKINKICFAYM